LIQYIGRRARSFAHEQEDPRRPVYPADKARGGDIVLRRTWQRVVFAIGLAMPFVLLLLILALR
jgi:hypothetical protein